MSGPTFLDSGIFIALMSRKEKDWTKVFPGPLNAQVIAERLTERAEVFVMDGKKYRDPRNHQTI